MAYASRRARHHGDPVSPAPPLSARDAFRRFWPCARPDRHWLPVAAALLIAGSAGELASVWLFKHLIDEVLVPRHFAAFWLLAAAMIVAALLAALLRYLGDYTVSCVAERFLLRLRTAVVGHLHTLPPDVLRSRRHGDLVARLTTDLAEIEHLVASGLVDAGSALAGLLFFGAAAFYLSWPLALAALLATPLFWLAARAFGARIQTRSREARRRAGELTAVVEESLANSAVCHAYNQQQREVGRVRRSGEELMRAELAAARVAHLYPALLGVVEVAGSLAVVGLGAFELTRSTLTLGGLLAFAALLAELFSPVQQLSGLAASFGSARAGAERVAELLDTRGPVPEPPGTRLLAGPVRGRLSCENLTFAYPTDRHRPALRNVTFSVAPGEILAVMGPSGAGKSTLAKLLVRFMDPDTGTVRLDGTDLREVSAASVRQAVTLLPQQPQLFHASVRDNIAYGRPWASTDEIIAAAMDADAHDFILALPSGYDSVLGEHGFQLSGGQAQRIAIARALLRATPLLVLDEPTAGLDARSARHILEPLRRLMAGRTTVLITHDHALACHADAIYTLPCPPPAFAGALYGGRAEHPGRRDAQAAAFSAAVDRRVAAALAHF